MHLYLAPLLFFTFTFLPGLALASPGFDVTCPPTNNLSTENQVLELIGAVENGACIQKYKEHKCAELKKKLDPTDQDKVITCDQGDDITAGIALLSCGDGFRDYFIDLSTGLIHSIKAIPELPGAVMAQLNKSGEFIKKCNEDAEFRKNIFSPVAPLYSTTEQTTLLKELPCEGLLNTVRSQTKNTLQEIAQKKKMQAKFQGRPIPQTIPEKIKLTPGEEEFQQNYIARSDTSRANDALAFKEIWKSIRQRLSCYRTAAAVELTCKIATEIATRVLIGPVATTISKSKVVQDLIMDIESKVTKQFKLENTVISEAKPKVISSMLPRRVVMTPEERVQELAKTAKMTRKERAEYTSTVIHRELKPEEEKTLWAAHVFGKENLEKYGYYTAEDIKEKAKILREHFNQREIDQIMRRGIAGEVKSEFALSELGKSSAKAALIRAGFDGNSNEVSEVLKKLGYEKSQKPLAEISSSDSQTIVNLLTSTAVTANRAGEIGKSESLYRFAFEVSQNTALKALDEGRGSVSGAYTTRSYAFRGAFDQKARDNIYISSPDALDKLAVQNGYFNKIENGKGFEEIYNPLENGNPDRYQPGTINLHGKSPEEVYLANNRQLQELQTLLSLKQDAKKASYGMSTVFSADIPVPPFLSEVSSKKITEYIKMYKYNLDEIEKKHLRKP